ncbi:MAG: signal peptide peptidase SppA [Bacteroidales bacterium]|nr:signal peptide peptidase SppA [Bacteroidales bacterium]
MKQFFKFLLASVLGTFITLFVGIIIILSIIVSAVSFSKEEGAELTENTILHLTLDGNILDREPSSPLAGFDWAAMEPSNSIGLTEVLNTLKKAAEDPKIMGILLDLNDVDAGLASISEIRKGILDFKESGKFVICYSEYMSQKAYFLASAADKVYLQPEGSIDFKGIMFELMFFKNTLEKLDVEAQIIRHGKFKSAIEPFIYDRMSPENREQMERLASSMWAVMLDGISTSRKIDIPRLNQIADSLLPSVAEKAKSCGIVDNLLYRDELITELKNLTATDSATTLKTISFSKYMQTPNSSNTKVDRSKRIAVIYAQGEIESGKGNENSIGSLTLSNAIRKARLDKKIKAIVLRVNSPGGSSLASDVIWREIELAKKEKPVVASFGDLAASGGYYIACGADKIFASPGTITGSIGVFAMIPNAQKFLNNRLGITFDEVKTNQNSDFVGLTKPMSTYQKELMLRSVEDVYDVFISHVAEGRKISKSYVDSIGQGRVWTGIDAKTIGLIDEFGGLEDAIAEAAKMAGIENPKIINLPEPKDPFTEIIESITNKPTEAAIKKELGSVYTQYEGLKKIISQQGIQARIPFEIIIK